MNKKSQIDRLLEKGVKIPNPKVIHISADVDTDRISGNGVIIYGGCRISGMSTVISENVHIGYEGPVTIENCRIGPDVNLKGGFFCESVFLRGVSMGSGSHVREGCILEEESSVAHTVGLKQTILFPFVTLGSLINFCDCLMAGGTGRKNHSEVGSSYIHFNFTPNQDKATPSLIGDVPKGVMLREHPIFLGGQGGLVGPCRLAYGTVIAAGSICRKDELKSDRLIATGEGKPINAPFNPGFPRNRKRIVTNNIIYIANLMALMQWYGNVRSRFISEEFPEIIFLGMKEILKKAIHERIFRLEEFFKKHPMDPMGKRWPEVERAIADQGEFEGDPSAKDVFLKSLDKSARSFGKSYISTIQGMRTEDATIGTIWLQGIVDHIVGKCRKVIELELPDKSSRGG